MRFSAPTLAVVLGCATACSPSAPELRLPDAGVPLNKFFNLEVTISDLPVDAVAVDADMPEHGHGMVTTPKVHPMAPGRWLVQGMLFHMPGSWEIYVDVLRKGERKRTVFPVEVSAFGS